MKLASAFKRNCLNIIFDMNSNRLIWVLRSSLFSAVAGFESSTLGLRVKYSTNLLRISQPIPPTWLGFASRATLHFFRNFWMGPISWRVALHKAWKTCQKHRLHIIGPIHKLQRKWIVVKTATDFYDTFWCNIILNLILTLWSPNWQLLGLSHPP
jgi:hypothetical protein